MNQSIFSTPSHSLAIRSHETSPAYYAPSDLIATDADLGIMRRGSQAITTDNCRALLTANAIENAALLAMIFERCYGIAPWGDEHFLQICAAYAATAADDIRRFW